jgi:hypothetical protein
MNSNGREEFFRMLAIKDGHYLVTRLCNIRYTVYN